MVNRFLSLVAVSATFSSTYCLTNIFPYIGFMVVHFYPGSTKEESGYRAGLLASCFMFARIPASLLLGYLADIVGRKPILLLGAGTMCVFQILFGLSPSFEFAIITRSLMGLFSGVVGTSKTVASELVEGSPKEQAKAMNIFSGASSLGQIIGPAASGLLYDPAKHYPNVAFLQVFDGYPFLLPNLLSAAFSFVSFVAILFFLPETLPNAQPISFIFPLCRSSNKYSQVHVEDEEDIEQEQHEGQEEEEQEQEQEEKQGDKADVSDIENDNSSSCTKTRKKSIAIEKSQTRTKNPEANFWDFLKSIQTLWKRDLVKKSVFVYSFYSLIGMQFSEVFPLWLIANPGESGGFGLDAAKIGFIISISASILLVFQVFVFPYIAGLFPPTKFAVVVCFISAMFYAHLPLVGTFPEIQQDYLVLTIVLVSERAIQMVLNLLMFTQSNVMVNNSCEQKERGTVNGICMSVGSIFKAAAPVSIGTLFAWSINNGIQTPPFNFWLSFLELSTLCASLALYIKYMVPDSLNEKVAQQ